MKKSVWQLLAAVMAALFTPKSFAVAATAATAGVTAQAAGVDPWPWVIGAFGAAIVYVKKPATGRLDAITNAVISVMIGGLVPPLLSSVLSKWVDPTQANQYAMSFILSAIWPWLVPFIMTKAKDFKLPSLGGGQQP